MGKNDTKDAIAAVYGGYANKLIKLQNDLLQTLDRRRRGNSQSIVVKHVHIHPGAQGWSEL